MTKPHGELALQTLAMPANTNANGDIFGGWLMSQMDLAAGILARRCAKKRVVTIAVDSMSFLYPVQVGDTVGVYGDIIHVGKTSMQIHLEVWVSAPWNEERDTLHKVTEGTFTFVAINEQGKPTPVK